MGNQEELFSADPNRMYSRAMNDARFARSGMEAGYTTKALLLMTRGLEKLLMFHCMKRNIAFPRDSSHLLDHLNPLRNTELFSEDLRELCERLDDFQKDQQDQVIDAIHEKENMDTFSGPDVRPARDGEDSDQIMLDPEEGEWSPEGWRKTSEEKNRIQLDMEGEGDQTEDDSDRKKDTGQDTTETGHSFEDQEMTPEEPDVEDPEQLFQEAESHFQGLAEADSPSND